jgi:hypothetical protein
VSLFTQFQCLFHQRVGLATAVPNAVLTVESSDQIFDHLRMETTVTAKRLRSQEHLEPPPAPRQPLPASEVVASVGNNMPRQVRTSALPAGLQAFIKDVATSAGGVTAYSSQREKAIRQYLAARPKLKADDVIKLEASIQQRAATLLSSSKAAAAAAPGDLHLLVSDITRWKLMLGQFRPGLLQQVQRNKPESVQAAVQSSLQELEKPAAWTPLQGTWMCVTTDAITASVKHLSELGGVGPATATAVLSYARLADPAGIVCDGPVPFMSDEAMKELDLVPLKYDFSTLRKFADLIQDCQNVAASVSPDLGIAVTASGAVYANVLFTKQLLSLAKR